MKENTSPQSEIHAVVQSGYAEVARDADCGGGSSPQKEAYAQTIGYHTEDLAGPAGDANLGLGCGNPTALAALQPGEVVVDLGSGAGFDALIAAEKLGETGRFIGVDMTPEMLERARINAVKAGYARTVEFREGFIEALPVTSDSVDVIISNCVVNLSPDKAKVFQEAYRVLKPGGRLAVSDILLTAPLPQDIAEQASAWIACIAGASTEDAYVAHMKAAGFANITFTRQSAASMINCAVQDPMWQAAMAQIGEARLSEISKTVFSYAFTAVKEG